MVTKTAQRDGSGRHKGAATADVSPATTDEAGTGRSAPSRVLQNWFYYVDSATSEGRGIPKEAFRALGRPGWHPDDWESYQVRIRPDGSDSRAGSHCGYNYEGWGSGRVSPPRIRLCHAARAALEEKRNLRWQRRWQRWGPARGPHAQPIPAARGASRGGSVRRQHVGDRRGGGNGTHGDSRGQTTGGLVTGPDGAGSAARLGMPGRITTTT